MPPSVGELKNQSELSISRWVLGAKRGDSQAGHRRAVAMPLRAPGRVGQAETGRRAAPGCRRGRYRPERVCLVLQRHKGGTLHDAIYSTVRSLPALEEAFEEVFDAIGCRLTLKREAR